MEKLLLYGKTIDIPKKWTLLRSLGKDILSLKAQEKTGVDNLLS